MNIIGPNLKIHYTCGTCHSGNEISLHKNSYTKESVTLKDKCHICGQEQDINISPDNHGDELHMCYICGRKDFYQQKDFNRKIGVLLFIIAALLSVWTYGISLIILYLIDLFLFSRLGNVVVCYKCQTIYRNVSNLSGIQPFNHEMNDRIIYSDHDFQGKSLSH